MRLRRPRDAGYSLIELSVVSATLMIVMAATFSLLETGVKTERGQSARADMLMDLRGAVTRLSKDLRQATYVDPGSTTTRLVMKAYVAGLEKTVTYEYDVAAGTLSRNTCAPADPPCVATILAGLEGAQLFCYDPPTCGLANPRATSSVIRLRMSVKRAASGPDLLTIAEDIKLRNVR